MDPIQFVGFQVRPFPSKCFFPPSIWGGKQNLHKCKFPVIHYDWECGFLINEVLVLTEILPTDQSVSIWKSGK